MVSNSIHSPSTLAVIEDLKTKYPTVEHINYDPISYHGLIEGNNLSFGKSVIPSYHFDKAKVIVSFGADFLGDWLTAEKFTKDYTSKRMPGDDMSQHIHFESNMSLTGSNADIRYPMQNKNQGMLLISLYNEIAKVTGSKQMAVAGQADVAGQGVSKTAKALIAAKGNSLVVCGGNNPQYQVIVNAINMALGNYASTININNPVNLYTGNDMINFALNKSKNTH